MKENRKCFKAYIFFLLLGFPFVINAQIPEANSLHDTINQDDLGDFKSEFQEVFFEALTYRAIENYERAITSLNKAEELKIDDLSVYFELGKNHASLEEFQQAENYFLKVLEKRPQDILVLQALKDVYQSDENYAKAIEITKQLNELDFNYTEELAKLYLKEKKYQEALKTLDEYEVKKGYKDSHQTLKSEIYKKAKPVEVIEEYLKEKIEENPENNQHYIALIKLYLSIEKQQKAEKIAEDFQEINPENKEEINALLTGGNLQENQSEEQLGKLHKEKDKQKAIEHFEKALQDSPNDFKLIKEILSLQIEEKQYEKALALAEEKISIFPTQALLYFYAGKAENALEKYESAKENLSIGVDFVVDNSQLTLQFYQELAKSYQKLGNLEKASEFEQKANKLK